MAAVSLTLAVATDALCQRRALLAHGGERLLSLQAVNCHVASPRVVNI